MPFLLSRVKEKISIGGQLREEKKRQKKSQCRSPFHWTLKPSFFLFVFMRRTNLNCIWSNPLPCFLPWLAFINHSGRIHLLIFKHKEKHNESSIQFYIKGFDKDIIHCLPVALSADKRHFCYQRQEEVRVCRITGSLFQSIPKVYTCLFSALHPGCSKFRGFLWVSQVRSTKD